MTIFRHAPLSLLMMVSLANIAFANNNDELPHTTLDPLVVTATKTPTKTSNLLAQTKVLTAKDLAYYQGQNLFDVIKNQVGISSYNSGGTDKASNFYMRGFDSKSILLIIDGVRYGSLTTGQPALGLLSVNEVERVEILYGASGSSVYGANAMGGVIQVFTKKGNADGSKVAVSVGAGSHNSLTYGLSAGFANENTKLSLSANHGKSDGINAVVLPYHPQSLDDDGFDRQSASFALSHRMGQFETGLNALASKTNVDYDNTWSSESDIYDKQKGGAVSVYGVYHYGKGSDVRLQYGQSLDESKNFAGVTMTGEYQSQQKQANLSLAHVIGLGKVLAGVEHLTQQVKSNVAYSQTKRNNTAVYLGYQGGYDKLDAQAFVRYDDNSWYGKDTTYNIGLAYRIAPNLRAGVNYATGFRSPTFNELYYPSSIWGGGNPTLQPETSKNSEAFIEWIGANHKTRITGYQSDIKDLIVGWPAKNISKAKMMGATLNSDWRVGRYVFGANYEYQEANDVTPTATGEKAKSNLAFRPEHKGGVYVGYVYDKVNIRAEYQRLGGHYALGNHDANMQGYGLLNLSGTYELTPYISITQRFDNVLNKRYTTNESFGTRYNADGANFHTAITFKY